MEACWDLTQLTGYLNTWSAVERYKLATGESPLHRVEAALQQAWGDRSRKRRIRWPLAVHVVVKPRESS